MLTCRECNAAFDRKPGRGRTPHFCSDKCRAAYHNRRRSVARADQHGALPKGWGRGVLHQPRLIRCSRCSVEFTSTHGRRIYCSALCRRRSFHETVRAEERPYLHFPRCKVFIKDCGSCTRVYVARGAKSVACSGECRRRYWTEHQREKYQKDPEGAARRVRQQRATQTAEQAERERERKKRWREQAGYFESKRAGDQRRRARMLGAKTEKFGAGEIYERDSWHCGICDKRVRKELSYPHPMSASIDHVIPLSLGGDHTRANVRLAHLRCNITRGNRMGSEQLALIG